jgi:hypothetical protein
MTNKLRKALMAGGSGKTWRKDSWPSRIYDPKNGIDVNAIKTGLYISGEKYKVSAYDDANILIRNENGIFREPGIMRRVRYLNRYKSFKMNGFVGQLNRKVYNV